MIRKAIPKDCGRIAEINVFGWRTAYRNIISDKYLFKNRSVIDTYNSMSSRLMSKGSDVFVHEEDEIVKGFITVSPLRDDDHSPNSLELVAIYVDPSFWKCGVGSQMLNHFEAVAREKDKKDLYIWVLDENGGARKFYEKHGYEHDGKEKYFEPGNLREVRYFKSL